MANEGLPILPTSVIGVHCRYGWYDLALEKYLEGGFGEEDIEEAFDCAVDAAIRDMERAGVDIITDGEMRRPFGYVTTHLASMGGLEELPQRRKYGAWGFDQWPRYRATDRLQPPSESLGLAQEFAYLRANTVKATKATMVGPFTIAQFIEPGGPYGSKIEIARDALAFIRQAVREVAALGPDIIQIDDPVRDWVSPGELAEFYDEITADVPSTIRLALHICFGNNMGRSRSQRSYLRFLPDVFQCRAEQYALEFANRELAELDEVGAAISKAGKHLAAGLIDVKSFWVEPAEEVARRIRRALEVVPAEQLSVVPDCGFRPTPPKVCNAKLAAMVQGTRLVRQELS